ncbi:hypothetical protein NKDENANG_00454 [Candidatus Entotheonellaceae bacterium PAL068K]
MCPALVLLSLTAALYDTALRAFRALECRNWCRVDMRLSEDGLPRVLELSPNAGIDSPIGFPGQTVPPGWIIPRSFRLFLTLPVNAMGSKLDLGPQTALVSSPGGRVWAGVPRFCRRRILSSVKKYAKEMANFRSIFPCFCPVFGVFITLLRLGWKAVL